MAAATGLSVHTLRLYEREGLLTGPVRRGPGGWRVYTEWDVEWLANLRLFRASGMPLAVIRRLAELVRDGSGNEEERLALLEQHQRAVLAQSAELDRALDLIDRKVEAYRAHLAEGNDPTLWSPPAAAGTAVPG